VDWPGFCWTERSEEVCWNSGVRLFGREVASSLPALCLEDVTAAGKLRLLPGTPDRPGRSAARDGEREGEAAADTLCPLPQLCRSVLAKPLGALVLPLGLFLRRDGGEDSTLFLRVLAPYSAILARCLSRPFASSRVFSGGRG